jgi:hypothetical protein
VFKWLLAPATIIGVFSFVVFILADFERMKTLRLIERRRIRAGLPRDSGLGPVDAV